MAVLSNQRTNERRVIQPICVPASTCIAVLRLLRNERLVAVAAAARHRAADVGVEAAAAATARQGILSYPAFHHCVSR